MTPLSATLLAFAVEDAVLVAVALAAIGLLGLFLSMRKKLRDSIVQKTKAEVSGELLDRAARSRATLVKLATYQDADELRDLALRETGQALGAVAV